VSRGRGPSSEADPARGGVQPLSEADLARGGAQPLSEAVLARGDIQSRRSGGPRGPPGSWSWRVCVCFGFVG
jgi:hypothetical protein